MAVYRTGKWETWSGTIYYAIQKRTLLGGWKTEKSWDISELYGLIKKMPEDEVKNEMNRTVERLVRAGHTVL